MFIDKDELLNELERKYGNLTDDYGCTVSTEHGWEWLTIKRIVDIINDCEEFDYSDIAEYDSCH